VECNHRNTNTKKKLAAVVKTALAETNATVQQLVLAIAQRMLPRKRKPAAHVQIVLVETNVNAKPEELANANK